MGLVCPELYPKRRKRSDWRGSALGQGTGVWGLSHSGHRSTATFSVPVAGGVCELAKWGESALSQLLTPRGSGTTSENRVRWGAVTLFGNRVFADVIKLRSYRSRMSPNPVTCVLTRKGNGDPERQLHTGRLCGDGDRGWSAATTYQGTARTDDNPRSQGRHGTDPPLHLQKEPAKPANSWITDSGLRAT